MRKFFTGGARVGSYGDAVQETGLMDGPYGIDAVSVLEFTNENLLDADISVEALAQLATELQAMTDEDRSNLSTAERIE
jgi:hypothetical protein